jgi:hypothetical protein
MASLVRVGSRDLKELRELLNVYYREAFFPDKAKEAFNLPCIAEANKTKKYTTIASIFAQLNNVSPNESLQNVYALACQLLKDFEAEIAAYEGKGIGQANPFFPYLSNFGIFRAKFNGLAVEVLKRKLK